MKASPASDATKKTRTMLCFCACPGVVFDIREGHPRPLPQTDIFCGRGEVPSPSFLSTPAKPQTDIFLGGEERGVQNHKPTITSGGSQVLILLREGRQVCCSGRAQFCSGQTARCVSHLLPQGLDVMKMSQWSAQNANLLFFRGHARSLPHPRLSV